MQRTQPVSSINLKKDHFLLIRIDVLHGNSIIINLIMNNVNCF